MKVLVVGCNGLLGQNLLRTLPAGWEASGLGTDAEPALPGKLSAYERVDISDRSALRAALAKTSPDWIFNVAAMTNVDGCEKDPEACNRINRDAAGWLAEAGPPLVHISTDYVFDGESGPYGEEDAPRPLSAYGRGKLESEALVLGRRPGSLVIRTMTLWGRGHGDKTSFVDFVRQSLAAGKTIRIVTDQWGNPTLAEDLALAIWELAGRGKSGLYHVAGSERNTRFQWARAIAAFHGLDQGLIQPCLTSDLKQPAARPLNSGLRIDKLVRDTGFRPRDVAGQLRRMQAPA